MKSRSEASASFRNSSGNSPLTSEKKGIKKKTLVEPSGLTSPPSDYSSLTSKLFGVPLTKLCTSSYGGSRWIRPYLSPNLILLIGTILELITAYCLQVLWINNPSTFLSISSSTTTSIQLNSAYVLESLFSAAQGALYTFLLAVSFFCFVFAPVYSKKEKLKSSIDPFCFLLFRFLHLYALGHIVCSVIIYSSSLASSDSFSLPVGALLPGLRGTLIFLLHLKELQNLLKDCRSRREKELQGANHDAEWKACTHDTSLPSKASVPFLRFPPLPTSLPLYPPSPSRITRWIFDSQSALESFAVLIPFIAFLWSVFLSPLSLHSARTMPAEASVPAASFQHAAQPFSLGFSRCLGNHPNSFPLLTRNFTSPSDCFPPLCALGDAVGTSSHFVAISRWMAFLGIDTTIFSCFLESLDGLSFSSSFPGVVFPFAESAAGGGSWMWFFPWKDVLLFFKFFWWWIAILVVTVATFIRVIISLVSANISISTSHGRAKKLIWFSSLIVLFASWVLAVSHGSICPLLKSGLTLTGVSSFCAPSPVGLCILLVAFDIMWSSYVRTSCPKALAVRSSAENSHLSSSSSLPSTSISVFPCSSSGLKAKENESALRHETIMPNENTDQGREKMDFSNGLPSRNLSLPPSLPVLDTSKCPPIPSLLLFFLLTANVFVNLCFFFSFSTCGAFFISSVKERLTFVAVKHFAEAGLMLCSLVLPTKDVGIIKEKYEKTLELYNENMGNTSTTTCISSLAPSHFSSLFVFLLQLLPTVLCIVGLLLRLSSSHFQVPILAPVRNVFIDGVFDLCHVGHKRLMKGALSSTRDRMSGHHKLAGGNQLFVGVCGDEECVNYKRLPIMSTEERVREVENCGFAAVVIPYSPVKGVSREILEYYNIHVAFCSEEYDTANDTYYTVPRSMKILDTLPRTQGISTSDILKRIEDREKCR